MRMTDHLPEPGSLAHRLCAHLRANPGDAVPAARLPRLFGVRDPITAAQMLRPVLVAKLLRSTGTGADAVYEAGANLADTPLAGEPEPASAATDNTTTSTTTTSTPAADTPGPGRGGRRTRLPLLDLDKIEVRTGVPLPTKHVPDKGDSQYVRLIEAKLSQPGHMVELPLAYHGAVLKAVTTWAKANPKLKAAFKVRRIGDGKCGVWRIS